MTKTDRWELIPGNSIWYSDVRSRNRHHYGVSKKGNWYYQTFTQYYDHPKVPNYKRTLKRALYVKKVSYGIRAFEVTYKNRKRTFHDVTSVLLVSGLSMPDRAKSSLDAFLGTDNASQFMSLPWDRHPYIEKITGKYLQTTSPKKLCLDMLGEARKDLIKVAVRFPHRITQARQYKHPNVPIDWIVRGTEASDWLGIRFNASDYDFFADTARPSQLRSFVETGQVGTYLNDILSMWRSIYHLEGFRPKDFGSNPRILHDQLIRFRNTHRARIRQLEQARRKEKSLETRKSSFEMYQDLHNLEIENLRFQVAQTADELFDWSSEMQNCISSYSDSPSGLVGVYEGEKLLANLELDKTDRLPFPNDVHTPTSVKVKQCLGKYNYSLEEKKRDTIYEALKKVYKNVDTSAAWQ